MEELKVVRYSWGRAEWRREVTIKQEELDKWIDEFKARLVSKSDADTIPAIDITKITKCIEDYKTIEQRDDIKMFRGHHGEYPISLCEYIINKIDNRSYDNDPELMNLEEERAEVSFPDE